MNKSKKLWSILKIVILGIASFSFGLTITVLLLTSLSISKIPILQRIQLPRMISFNYRGFASRIPKLYIVQSGSMEPAIKTGSVVVSYPSENYVQGDVITFAPNGDSKKLITHRIVFKLYPDGADSPARYITGGDANEDFDTWEIKDEYILGKNILNIPYLGYLANYAKTPYGFLLLVIVPATIIIYEELKSLLNEIRTLLKSGFSKIKSRFKRRKLKIEPEYTASQGENFKDKDKGIPKVSVLLPIFGASIVFLGLTASFFSDIENSIGNLFQAGEWSQAPQGPQPGDVVINELMWMGSTKGASDEWIELRNTTSNTIDISGWQLTKWVTSGTDHEELMFTISAGKSIPPGGFFLIAQFPSGDPGSALNVTPDEISTSVTLSNTALQIRLFVSNWDTGGTLIDTAGNKSTPLAGNHKVSQPKKFYSMERNSTPGDGTISGSWHTANTSVGFDSGEDIENRGTPKSANSPP